MNHTEADVLTSNCPMHSSDSLPSTRVDLEVTLRYSKIDLARLVATNGNSTCILFLFLKLANLFLK
eukprot:SAG11_NODE_166_length_13763_cov_8.292722_9_plen_66_part_00